MRRFLLAAIVGLMMVLSADAQEIYRDSEQPIEHRVADLLERMTLEEKAAQLVCIWVEKSALLTEEERFDAAKATDLLPHGAGCLARPSDRFTLQPVEPRYREIREAVEFVNAAQEWAMSQTRLGIPLLMHEEGLHGFQARGATHFPQAIALAGTFDEELLERIYTVVAREIRARGAHHVLSPVVDVARDARWGRIEETYGEDPFLVGRMGLAAVKGFQGDSIPIARDRVLATLKHMTGHGQPESGTNVGPAQISERTLREMFFPPFEVAIRDGNAQSVMASYNEIDGIPSHANDWLLGDILRGEWGFEGMVVADYGAIRELERRHGVAADAADAAIQALRAGVDIELPDRDVYRLIPELVQHGALPIEVVDTSVARILTAKFRAGLFEHPLADAAYAEEITDNDEARALALEAARKAVVLLKNQDNLLPVDPEEARTIAVVGAHSADALLGGYSDIPGMSVSILEGVRARVGSRVQVVHSEGARITDTRGWWTDEVRLPDPEEDAARVDEAVRVSANADLAIVVVGDNEQTSREAWVETHLGDRTSLKLVGRQLEMTRPDFLYQDLC